MALPSTAVTFGPGISRACVGIQLLEDTEDEIDEFFQVSVQSNSNQLLVSSTRNSAEICITDNDREYNYLFCKILVSFSVIILFYSFDVHANSNGLLGE